MKAIFMATGILAMLSLSACERKDNIENSPAPEVAVMTDDAAAVAATEPDAAPAQTEDGAARFGEKVVRLGDKIPGHYDKERKYWRGEADSDFSTHPFGDKYTLFWVVVEGKNGAQEIGLVDENGVVAVLPVYSSFGAKSFDRHGFLIAKRQGKYGLLNRQGREAVPPEFDNMWLDPLVDGMVKVQKDGAVGFINYQGRAVIPIKYAELEGAGSGLIWFREAQGWWGCVNYQNEIVVKPEFARPSKFEQGKTVSQKADEEDYTIYKDGRVEKK